jgi:hypothetical protein
MLQWDALGETRLSFGGVSGGGLEVACAALDACTLPLVVHDYQRAAVLGTATLLIARGRPLLLTAAHVLEGGVRLGNVLVPAPSGHRLVALAGARVACCESADIAVIDISGVAGVALLLRGRVAAPVPRPPLRRRRRRVVRESGRVLLSGYPAVLSRFERGWLGARRFTMVTRRRDEAHCASARTDHLFDYGHVACRADGVPVHTPELQGMSGAGIWILEHADGGAGGRLRLVAVQSSYLHGGFVRGHDIGAAQELLQG